MKKNKLKKCSIDVEGLKLKQLIIFEQFKKICDVYGLKYFLTGGTALGAVRHKGFIPWDDDIDVCMPRNDYEIFLSKAQDFLPKNLFVQTYLTDFDYRLPFAKIRDSSTTYIEYSSQNLKINHGIYLDIFPIDGFPKDKKRQLKMLRLKKLTMIFVGKDYTGRSIFKKICSYAAGLLLGTFNTKKALQKFDTKCKLYSFENSELTILYGGAWGSKEIHERTTYGNGKIAKFEGIDVVIPENYDKFLTELYGNYMELPPLEKRVGHHDCCAFSLTESYKNFLRS